MNWEEICRRLEAGERQAAIASELALTLGQFRYRLKRHRAGQTGVFPAEKSDSEKGGALSCPSLHDEGWTRIWGMEQMMAMVINPTTIFSYWEVTDGRKRLVERHFGRRWADLITALQIYDVTDILFDGKNAHWIGRIPVDSQADHAYLRGVRPGRRYLVDLGVVVATGEFLTLLRSPVVATPFTVSSGDLGPYLRFGKLHMSFVLQRDAPVESTHLRGERPYEQQFDGYTVVQYTGGLS